MGWHGNPIARAEVAQSVETGRLVQDILIEPMSRIIYQRSELR